MDLRFPVITPEVFREWLRLWRRFYRDLFSLRYNFQSLRERPRPPGEFSWPIVVGGRESVTLQSLCWNGRQSRLGSLVAVDKEVWEAIKAKRLISLRRSGDQSYVVWTRDPRQPNNCLIGVDCRQLSRQHDTTTVEEEVLLRLFLRFCEEQTLWQPPVLLCADSWIEDQSVITPSGKIWPAIQRFPAFIGAGEAKSSRLISVPPRAIGAAREVFIP